MDYLWAPWRMTYLQGAGAAEDDCFMCALGAELDSGERRRTGEALGEPDDYVVWRGERAYAVLNLYPYASGHVLVVPTAHEGALDRLDGATAAELMEATRLVIRALRLAYQPQGFNVGANLGAAAGAGFGEHLHIHVVPRWGGDTNFMTTTGQVRVLPEALADTARRLRAALAEIPGDR